MSLTLGWMRPHAPYMPIATAGLLALLERAGTPGRAGWRIEDGGRAVLAIETALTRDALAEMLAAASWPDEQRIRWPGGSRGSAQALKPLLKERPNPLRAFRDLVRSAGPLEAALLRAILTDGALDADDLPLRSRLLRGVKADLTSAFRRPRGLTTDELAAELHDGPQFRTDAKGLGLGLVPEVQTFGATTGPDPSTIDAYSPLLALLLWNGIIALPPFPVLCGRTRTVGGPLVTDVDVISWPRWTFPADLATLRTLYGRAEIHADRPDLAPLRDVDRVYRSRAVELNNMIAVFRWGEEVSG